MKNIKEIIKVFLKFKKLEKKSKIFLITVFTFFSIVQISYLKIYFNFCTIFQVICMCYAHLFAIYICLYYYK